MVMCSNDLIEYRPTFETLESDTRPTTETVCPVYGCDKTFSNSSHLTLHKAKVHGIDKDSLKPGDKSRQPCRYYCPINDCHFNKDRHFANYKLLKQHYRGIHGEKKFVCSKCSKSFALDKSCKRHEVICGVIFNCKTCQCPYTTREALYMHCSRKKHELPQDVTKSVRKYKKKENSSRKDIGSDLIKKSAGYEPQPCVIFVSRMDPQLNKMVGTRTILPKPVINSVIPMTRVRVDHGTISVEKFAIPSKLSTEIQTDIFGVNNALVQEISQKKPSLKQVVQASTATQVSLVKPQIVAPSLITSSTGMQTNLSVLPKKRGNCSITGTQTSGDYILKSAMACAKIPIHDISSKLTRSKSRSYKRRSMKTSEVQTQETFPLKKHRRRDSSKQRSSDNIITEVVGENVDSIHSIHKQLLLKYGSSISTQTRKSFLGQAGQLCVQSSQTQTKLSTLGIKASERDNRTFMTINNEELPVLKDKSANVTVINDGGENCAPIVDDSQSFLDLLCDVPFPVVPNKDGITEPPRMSTMGTQMSPPHSTDVFLPPMPVGVAPIAESPWTQWNPCLASISAKDMHTQTMVQRFSDFGVQTSKLQSSNFLMSSGMDIDSNSAAADMHTQTADELLDFLMTNMETQTDDPFIAGFELSDIETQTPSDNVPFDSFVTTETQTNVHSVVDDEGDLTLLMDMETQTPFAVAEFGDNDQTDSHTQTSFDLLAL